MKKQLFILFYFSFLSSIILAQNIKVQGVVTSAEDGLPLPGVTVLVKGTTIGTSTDIDGRYVISAPTNGTLQFSYIGTKTQEKKIKSGTLNVVLENDAMMLDEVVAVGYGTMKKSDLTGSVSTISADQLKKTPAAGLDQALQGRAAGVTVNANTGQPGAGAEVRIRGIGTVNGADPLYVVDGVIVGDISFLNPNDISSTEILKDASATAIYGSRGANGVILVTTKKGSADGRTEISFNTYVGFQNRWNKLDLMKSDELARTIIALTPGKQGEKQLQSYTDGGLNGWLSSWRVGPQDEFYPAIKSATNPNGFDYSAVETDWQDEVFKKNALIQNYHLSIDGSTEKANYSFSVSYFDQDGTIIGSNYSRLTLRANTSFQVNKWLKIGENLSFVNSEGRNAMNNNSSPGASILSAALAMAPWDPAHYPAGTLNYKGEDLGGKIAAPSNFKNVSNPFGMVNYSHPMDKTERWVGDIYLEITPLKGLVYRSDISYDLSHVNHRLFKDAYYISSNDYSDKNFLERSMSRYATMIWENTLTYSKQIKDHDFSIMAGHTTEEYNYYNIGGSGSQILNPTSNNWYLSQTTQDRNEAGDGVDRLRRLSFLGRLHYSYKNRYLATANFRADGSNKFPENNWGFFPSVALGWKMSEENWMKGLEKIDFLKIRAGWGRIGNDKIGNDNFSQTMFNTGPYFVDYVLGPGDQALARGATVLTYKNMGGKWEVTETWNVGVDFGLFNGLLSGNVDLFRRDTKEMLLTVKGPAYIGNRYDATKNVGTVRNQGIEIALEHKNKINKVNYTINGNVSFIKNELTALNGGEVQYVDGIRINDEGYALYTFYGYKYEGIYRSDEEAKQHLWGYSDTEIPYHAGDAKFADLNNNGMIDGGDRTDIGNPFPWLTYGLNLGAEWKGFDVQLFFQGVYGNKIYNQVLNRTEGKGVEATLSTSMRDVWTKNNPNGSIPNPNTSLNYSVSDRFVENGAYLRLKNFQIGYTLPRACTSKIGINRCRFYVSASNLFTVTKYTGYDPEVASGVDYGNYPQSRTVMIGANLNF